MNLNKSFLYGIFFASITWTVSLYLFWQLNKDETYDLKPTPLISNKYYKDKNLKYGLNSFHLNNKISKNDVLSRNEEHKYENSEKLIKSLESIPQNVRNNSGKNLVLNELGVVTSLEEQKIRTDGYKSYAFNVLISNKLGYHREIPDTRNKLCGNTTYPNDLPAATVIICFYNEHFSTLVRSIHSVLERTPSHLLKEVILIDDYSNVANLHLNLTIYIEEHDLLKDKVKLFKTKEREGLIRARVFGARKATGEVLVFLDSHIEVNVDWLQPLLARIKENSTNVVTPIIDIINADTFRYTASPLVRGGFNWGLHFKWENLPTGTLQTKADFTKPFKSPTMAGGLFAINRQYFMNMGEYDAGMDIWGGENLEISFRIWMCGGRIEIIPCSRVGHVFRQRRPYGDPNGKDTMLRNSLRVAHVWMDDYKDYFLHTRPDAMNLNYGDVSGRVQLRRRLKCYDFDWYIKNVYPELTLPTDDDTRLKKKWSSLVQDKFIPWQSRKRNYVDQFQIRLSNTNLCISSKKDVKTKGTVLILKSCIKTKNQIWYETKKSELVLAQLLCLQSQEAVPYLYKCHEMGGNQEWKHKGESNSPIYNIASGTCLGVDDAKIGEVVQMKLCTDNALNIWDIVR